MGKKNYHNKPKRVQKREPRLAETPFSLEGKKHIMGAYFNMAQSNFYKTLIEIFMKSDVKVNAHWSTHEILQQLEKGIQGSLLKTNDQAVRMQRLLFRHFPILGPVLADQIGYQVGKSKEKKSNVYQTEELLRGASLEKCIKIVLQLGKTLGECRNYYTHFSPYNSAEDLKKQYDNQYVVAKYLEKAFTASRRIDKQRNLLTNEELEFLTGIDHYRKEKNENAAPGDYRSSFVFVEREDWYFRIRGERTIEETGEKNMALSDFGVLYFCAIFLSKSYAKRMIEETELLAPDKSPFKGEENDIVREMISIYRMRMPKGKRLDSNDTLTALAMDMLNELRKCPLPLYDVISQEGKDFFADEVKGDDEDLPETVKRIRSTDRFPALILRYIDSKKLFNTIRFQVKLGKFRFRFYEKNGVDGEQRVRTLQKEINGFGRLQEIEELRKKRWADLLQQSELMDVKLEDEETVLQLQQFTRDMADSKPYVTDHKASYNIVGNRIGLYWNAQASDCLKDGAYLPELQSKDGKASVEMPCPKASLSIYDLPAMAFYQYLLGKNNCAGSAFPSCETLIKETCRHLTAFFKDVYDGKVPEFSSKEEFSKYLESEYHGLHIQWIPEKLVNYFLKKHTLSASKLFKERSMVILNEKKERAERRLNKYKDALKAIGGDDNKYGKKGFADIRYNQMANYIAESLLDWQPSADNGRNKLTGQNYNSLVAFLATYYGCKSIGELRQLLVKAGLIGGNYQHPFIESVLCSGPKDIEALYRKYLEKEIEHLGKCIDRKVKLESIPFLHANRKKWQPKNDSYYRELAGRYLEIEPGKAATIFLPDGLFTPYILQLLKEKYADNESLMMHLKCDEDCENNGDDKIHNAAYLISRYFEFVRGDNGQPFYRTNKHDGRLTRFARTYDIFNILNNVKVRNALQPIYLSTDEIRERFVQKKGDKKVIDMEIKNHLAGMSYRDRGSHKTLEEAKEAMERKLRQAIRFCKDNERAIRRYKTQDMVIFLLAQELLQEIIPDNEQVNDRNFMLKKVCEKNFLSQTVRMEKDFVVDVEGEKKSFKVVHESMSLKNYGEFYRLVYDERLLSLLAQLANCKEISYADLNTEFARYDQVRSSVFEAIQDIERIIIDNYPELNQPDNEAFHVEGKTIPKRNNFKSLIALLVQTGDSHLSEDEKALIVSIRNAFSHNSYRIPLQETVIELPKVADLIFKLIDYYHKKVTGTK